MVRRKTVILCCLIKATAIIIMLIEVMLLGYLSILCSLLNLQCVQSRYDEGVSAFNESGETKSKCFLRK